MDWITELKRQVEELEAKNERLRAAVKEAGEIIEYFADFASEHGLGYMPADRWLALNGERQHGHVQSGEDEFGKTGRNEPEKP